VDGTFFDKDLRQLIDIERFLFDRRIPFLSCACRGHCLAPQSKFNARFPALCQRPCEMTMGSASNFSRWVEWRKFEKGTTGPPLKVGCGSIEACRGR
jgi:hypothetical protein